MKKVFTFIFIFYCFSIGDVFAQNLDTDSLRIALSEASESNRLTILNELGTNLREIDKDLALKYLFEAEKIAKDEKDKKALSRAKENIGWIYYREGQWQLSFDYSEEAYRLAIESSSLIEAARVLNNMGALYYAQRNYKTAILKFKEAYRLSVISNDTYTQIRSLNNIAFNFSLIDELDSATFYAKKSILANSNTDYPYLISFAYRVIGDVFAVRNQLDSAINSYNKSMELANKQDIMTFKATLYHRFGNIYLLQNKLDLAEKILKQGIVISLENKFLDELQTTYKVLAEVYKAKGDILSAYEQQSNYITLKDSLLSTENSNRLSLLQGQFENDLKLSEFELLKAQNENQATRLIFVNRTIWVISIAALLILGLGIWLFRLNGKTKKQNMDLAQTSKELEVINQTKNKLFSILGHDLRGPVGQVKLIVDLLTRGYLEKEEFDDLIQNLKKDVDSVYLTLNNTLKWSLSQLDGFKLNKSAVDLNELIDTSLIAVQPFLDEKNISVNKSLDYQTKVMIDLDLMQIVLRNIFSNAIKFSKPGQSIEISADHIDERVILCIIDHGTGMTAKQIDQILSENQPVSESSLGTNSEKGTGLGLQICKEFIKMNGGQLSIISQVKKGTKVCLSMSAA